MLNLNKYIFNIDYKLFLNFNYCFIKQNVILNQKFFYIDEKNFNNKNCLYFYTKANIKLEEEKKKELLKYFKNNNINDKFFKNFSGYFIIVKFEGYNKFLNEFKNGIFIYFINLILNEKLIIMLQRELDIKILLLILEYMYYFKVSDQNFFNKEEFIQYFNNKFYFQNFDFFFKFELVKNLNFFEIYLMNFKKIYFYFKGIFYNSDIHKKYIFLKNKQKKDFEKIKDIQQNEIIFFQNFDGIVFLLEANFIINKNNKIKRLVLLFYDIISENSYSIEIINKKNSNKSMSIIQNLLILNVDREKFYDGRILDLDFLIFTVYNKILNSIDFERNYILNFDFKNLVFFENNKIKSLEFSEIYLEKENLKLLQIEDKNELMFYLLYNCMVGTF